MKRPDEVTEYLRCGGANCDGACNTQLDKLGVEDCRTWRVHGYVQKLEERIVHLEALNHQNLSVITMQERTRAILQEQISQLESRVPRWVSVEERLPDDNRNVIVFIQHPISGHRWLQIAHMLRAIGLDECQDDEWWLDSNGETVSYITHWMPLPEPPKEINE